MTVAALSARRAYYGRLRMLCSTLLRRLAPAWPVLVFLLVASCAAAGASDAVLPGGPTMEWSDVAAIGSMAVTAALAWYVIKGQRSGFRTKKEEAADRAAIRNYQWYDGSMGSAMKEVERTRARCEELEDLLDRERDARREAVREARDAAREEIDAERTARASAEALIELRRQECEQRIGELQGEIDRLRAGH